MPELAEGWAQTTHHVRRPRRQRQSWSETRIEALKNLWADQNMRVVEIADLLETSPGAIYSKVHELGLPSRQKGRKQRQGRIRTSIQSDRTGQRRFKGVESTGEARIQLSKHHPVLAVGTTLFVKSVLAAGEVDRVLKSGKHSRKIGEMIEKGRWKGMPIFTLTLQERATCPRTCLEWDTCYGNNMPFAHRIHDDGQLEQRLRMELGHLAFSYPQGFVVRLHVLGDFFSVPYVMFWREALEQLPELHIFGFTARLPDERIGALLLLTRLEHRDRFCMRWSGRSYETDCSEVVGAGETGVGIPCPAESDPERCCATCGLCWQTDRTITFLRH